MTLTEADLRLGRRLGRGAVGEILDVEAIRGPDYGFPIVYKRYFDPSGVSGAGFVQLQQFHDALPDSTRALLDTRTSWPLAPVHAADGSFAGYVMPRLPDSTFATLHTATGEDVAPCELQLLFNDDRQIAELLHATIPQGYRVALALDLARIYALLDKHGVVYGDLSWKNAVWTPFADRPHLVLVDCDAVRLKGSRSAAPQMHSPGWTPPESKAGAQHQTVQTDRYKLALGILRILSPGLHSQVHTPNEKRDLPRVGPEGYPLLERALGADPDARPSAREWIGALEHIAAVFRFEPMRLVGPPRPQTDRPPAPRAAVGGIGAVGAVATARRIWRPAPAVVTPRPQPRRTAPVSYGAAPGSSWYPWTSSQGQAQRSLFRTVPWGVRPRPTSSGGSRAFVGVLVVLGLLWAMQGILIPALKAMTDTSATNRDRLFTTPTEPTSTTRVPLSRTSLRPGDVMQAGDGLSSPSGYRLRMQADGNLVLRRPDGSVAWQTHTQGHRGAIASVGSDGRLLIDDRSGMEPIWSSGQPAQRDVLVFIDGDHVVIRSGEGAVVWSSADHP